MLAKLFRPFSQLVRRPMLLSTPTRSFGIIQLSDIEVHIEEHVFSVFQKIIEHKSKVTQKRKDIKFNKDDFMKLMA